MIDFIRPFLVIFVSVIRHPFLHMYYLIVKTYLSAMYNEDNDERKMVYLSKTKRKIPNNRMDEISMFCVATIDR